MVRSLIIATVIATAATLLPHGGSYAAEKYCYSSWAGSECANSFEQCRKSVSGLGSGVCSPSARD